MTMASGLIDGLAVCRLRRKDKNMKTFEQHRQRHIELHRSLDELMADWITETEGLPSKCSLLDFFKWSNEQTENPIDRRGRFGDEIDGPDGVKTANEPK